MISSCDDRIVTNCPIRHGGEPQPIKYSASGFPRCTQKKRIFPCVEGRAPTAPTVYKPLASWSIKLSYVFFIFVACTNFYSLVFCFVFIIAHNHKTLFWFRFFSRTKEKHNLVFSKTNVLRSNFSRHVYCSTRKGNSRGKK